MKLQALPSGSVLPDALLEVAAKGKIRTATLLAIGGVDAVTLGYYNRRLRTYERHSYTGFMEVTSLLGNITQKDGEPFLHAHGTFGRRDMTVIGGHLIRARVNPTLEFVLTPTENTVARRLDRVTGLNLIGLPERE